MITVLFHVTVKAERDGDWRALLAELTQSTRAEDDGCVTYVVHRQLDQPLQYALYEQWRDEAALTAHLARLERLLGPPRAGGRLPAKFLDHFEETHAVRYEALG
jgi:quinol monooxygenase YgiN